MVGQPLQQELCRDAGAAVAPILHAADYFVSFVMTEDHHALAPLPDPCPA